MEKNIKRRVYSAGKISFALIAVIGMTSFAYEEVFSYSQSEMSAEDHAAYIAAFAEKKSSKKSEIAIVKQNQQGVFSELTKIETANDQIVATQLPGSAPFNVIFETKNKSQVKGCEWNFGDGEIGSGPISSHTFQYIGTYSVTLRTETKTGKILQDQITVTVSKPESGS